MQKSVHTHEYALLKDTLCQLRQDAGLSQRALAAVLGVPHSWVAKVESGERRIDVVEFWRFALACGANPTEALVGLAAKFPSRKAAARAGRRRA